MRLLWSVYISKLGMALIAWGELKRTQANQILNKK